VDIPLAIFRTGFSTEMCMSRNSEMSHGGYSTPNPRIGHPRYVTESANKFLDPDPNTDHPQNLNDCFLFRLISSKYINQNHEHNKRYRSDYFATTA